MTLEITTEVKQKGVGRIVLDVHTADQLHCDLMHNWFKSGYVAEVVLGTVGKYSFQNQKVC